MQNKNFLIIILALLTGGCIQIEEEFSINPDGTGKVKYVSETNYAFTLNSDNETEKEKALATVRDILEKSKGVSAWKDVSYKIMGEDRIKFTGTAYFKDISKLKIDSKITMRGLTPIFKRRADNTFYLALIDIKAPNKSATIIDEISDEEIEKKNDCGKSRIQTVVIDDENVFEKI